MEIILYNPLSKNGKTVKEANKLANKFLKMQKEVELYSVLDLNDISKFFLKYEKSDSIYIVGGDGTLNRLANEIQEIEIKPEVYLYKAGTGNDFYRSIKNKKKFIEIKEYLKNLPHLVVNDEKRYFLNGVGIGLDGKVCYRVNHSLKPKNRLNYMKNAFKSFVESKPFKATILIDDKELVIEKAWFISVMNAPYFGGGMKVAPRANRKNDTLEIVVVKDLSKFLLTLIFPSIYLGWHTMFRRYVKIYRGNKIEISATDESYMQIDGDDIYPVISYNVSKKKK